MDFNVLTEKAAASQINLENAAAAPIGFMLGATGSTVLGVGFLGWTFWRYRDFLLNYLRQWVRPRVQDPTVDNPPIKPGLHNTAPSAPPQSRPPPALTPPVIKTHSTRIPHSQSASAGLSVPRSATMSYIMYETKIDRV
jgi:hypothetical protein